jgi:predicted amidohydrolase YtcJ
VASLAPITAARAPTPPETAGSADLILRNGRIFTGDPARPQAAALAVSAGRITAVGNEADVAALAGPGTRVVNALGRRVIPGLNDSHIHLIRGGVNYLLELRWDGVPALSVALRMLREQAAVQAQNRRSDFLRGRWESPCRDRRQVRESVSEPSLRA